MANHSGTRTRQPYDRRRDDLTLDEVEKIGIQVRWSCASRVLLSRSFILRTASTEQPGRQIAFRSQWPMPPVLPRSRSLGRSRSPQWISGYRRETRKSAGVGETRVVFCQAQKFTLDAVMGLERLADAFKD